MTTQDLESDLNHVLDHTREWWDDLRGERIFITGGTGFFGCWLLESFIWANEKLNLKARASVLTRSPENFHAKVPHLANNSSIELVRGDVRTFSHPRGTFSHILHAASESSVYMTEADSTRMMDTIAGGTRRVLEFAVGAKARKFLFTSSGAVYGRQLPDVDFLAEDGPAEWKTIYPIDLAAIYREGKRFSETECSIFAQTTGLQIKIARCFAFVGPYFPLNAQYAIGNFIRDGLAGGTIRINGDGTPLRSYLYAADLAIWLWTLLFQGRSGCPYNVGSDRAISIAELAGTVAKCFQPMPKIEVLQNRSVNARPERYIPSTERARTNLNLKAWVGLDESIQRTIDWYKKF